MKVLLVQRDGFIRISGLFSVLYELTEKDRNATYGTNNLTEAVYPEESFFFKEPEFMFIFS